MTRDSNDTTKQSTSTDIPDWDVTWLRVAKDIAKRSKCDRAQVAAVFVDQNNNVLATSYNGPPKGMEVSGTCIEWCPRAQGIGEISNDYSNCPSNHAEINGLLRMINSGAPGVLITAYVTRLCCMTCTKALAGKGVHRVVCLITDLDKHLDTDATAQYFSDCGVIFDLMEDEVVA